jgi:hypothetical protein
MYLEGAVRTCCVKARTLLWRGSMCARGRVDTTTCSVLGWLAYETCLINGYVGAHMPLLGGGLFPIAPRSPTLSNMPPLRRIILDAPILVYQASALPALGIRCPFTAVWNSYKPPQETHHWPAASSWLAAACWQRTLGVVWQCRLRRFRRLTLCAWLSCPTNSCQTWH